MIWAELVTPPANTAQAQAHNININAQKIIQYRRHYQHTQRSTRQLSHSSPGTHTEICDVYYCHYYFSFLLIFFSSRCCMTRRFFSLVVLSISLVHIHTPRFNAFGEGGRGWERGRERGKKEINSRVWASLLLFSRARPIVCVRAFATTIKKSVYTFSFRIFILLLFYFPNRSYLFRYEAGKKNENCTEWHMSMW